MPRQSKSKTEVAETTPAVNTPVVNTPVDAAPVAKAKRETKPKVAKAEAVAAPAVETPVISTSTSTPAVAVDAVEAEVADLTAQSTEFLAKLNQLGALLASLKTEYRSLEKKWSREIKTAQKTNAKRKRKSGNRQPSGFVKPTKISDELAKFLEKPAGTEMARTDVTREINKYIRSHNLQDKENGRKINPDAKLQTLLKLKKTDELTYFNLQRYMSPHFSKAEKAVVAAVVA
jgi:upstream activation factor subunit UAF30